jgi:hypothetical protein
MSVAVLDHRLIREYLRELAAATRGWPDDRARELRDQITAHLDDALPPDADDHEVATTLSRLGAPAGIAAEAGAAVPAASERSALGLARALLAAVRLRTWIVAGLAVILVAAGAKYADHYWSAAPLQYSNGGDWWYRQDVRHQDIATTATATQNTTPIRAGQRQGYVVSVYNPTSVTQTIVGDASGPHGWNNPGSATEQLAVSSSYVDIANGFTGQNVAAGLSFTLPVAIPPLQTRLVRVLWTSRLCLGPGEANGIDTLALRVRVGWFTRTEVIPQQAWYLIGPRGRHCA